MNALDRVSRIKEQYEKQLLDIDSNIPVLQKLIEKPFEKEGQLKTMKQELSKLEREISLKIQENKMKQDEPKEAEELELEEAPVIEMDTVTEKQLPVQRSKKKARA